MNYAQRALQTIGKIDELAKSAAKLCSKNPHGAIAMLGTLRGAIEGLQSDIRVVENEREAYYRLASESLTDARMLVPMTNAEAMANDEEIDQCQQMDYYFDNQTGSIIYP